MTVVRQNIVSTIMLKNIKLSYASGNTRNMLGQEFM